MAYTLRGRVYNAIKVQKASKNSPTLELLGCSLEFLLEWFKFRFDENMTFENHGPLWHIDHVIPCSLFDLLDTEEIARCFHWTNLQQKIIEHVLKNK